MPIDVEQIKCALIFRGYASHHETREKWCFKYSPVEDYVYVNKTSGKAYSTLIVHPKYASERDGFLAINGVRSKRAWYHSSNLTKFPKEEFKGKSPIPAGIPLGFDSLLSLNKFLDAYLKALLTR